MNVNAESDGAWLTTGQLAERFGRKLRTVQDWPTRQGWTRGPDGRQFVPRSFQPARRGRPQRGLDPAGCEGVINAHLPAVVDQIRSWPPDNRHRFEVEVDAAIQAWGDEDDGDAEAELREIVERMTDKLGEDGTARRVARVMFVGGRLSNALRAQCLRLAGLSEAAISRELQLDVRSLRAQWDKFSRPPVAPAPPDSRLRMPE